MGKNIKGLAGSTIFNQKMVEQMNGINKNNGTNIQSYTENKINRRL